MDLLRRHLDAEPALAVGALAGGAVLLEVGGTLMSWLVNVYGPFEGDRWQGTLLAIGGGLASGVVCLLGVRAVALRSGAALALVVALLGTTLWVLLPQRIDVSESWVPRVNERWSCTGWTYHHYPVGVMDANGSTYCIGLEHRISDG